MSTDVTAKLERAVTEQSKTPGEALSSEQILTVIEQVHACYDYCAAWKQPTQAEEERAEQEEDQADITRIQRS
jgi:hypothetical protein